VPDESVGALAELYLGNILYALELAAISLESQGKGEDAAFYRGIARKLAEKGDRLVVTAGVPFDVPGTTNLLKVEEV